MTRINLVHVDQLLDQHLFAEWRELPRVFTLARALKPKEVVPTFRMGAGHVKFFYTKTGWLADRHATLTEEVRRRGYDIQSAPPLRALPGLDTPWEPNASDYLVSLGRLIDKQDMKPAFYRYNRQPCDPDHYRSLIPYYLESP